ncbi:MAG: deoxynucleoside kinase [Myxococcales bacterium]|nr:deoxynucleoside kinase [Myxococcales bacterium]
MPPRARYVAIEGPPGAGVSVLARRLATATGSRLVEDGTADNPFLQGFATDPRRFAFQAQVFFLLSRYRQQGELSQGDLFAQGGVVADYCFARDPIWARIALTTEELALYERVYALLEPRVPVPDLVVYVTARPEVLRARIQRRVRATDRVVEEGRIDEIARSLGEYFFRYEASPLLVVNTSEIDYNAGDEGDGDEARLAEIVAVIQRTKAGVNHYVPGDRR